MGADVFLARPDLLGAGAEEVLGWSLVDVCANGPDDELVRTDRAQPALYAISYALWEAFAAEMPHPPIAAAGHSLGEYTALAASGVVSYLEGLRLVAARGRAMARATAAAAGTMAAVMGADGPTAEHAAVTLREQGEEVWVANDNAPGQIVLAGSVGAIERLTAEAKELGLRRVIQLNVAGAFHTPLMEPARVELGQALAGVEFDEAAFPVWANLTAAPVADTAAALAGQLTGQVRFAESLRAMSDAGVEAFVHIGPSDVTAGMAKRTVKGAKVVTVSSLDDIGAALDGLAVV
jgi:[acyl-carrier-protein] S-malonyltransferase